MNENQPTVLVQLTDGEHRPVTLSANPNVTVEQAQALVNALQPFFPGAVVRLLGAHVELRVSAMPT